MMCRILAVLFIVSLTESITLAIKIIPSYSEYIVLAGEKLELNCSNGPNAVLKWYKNDTPLNSDNSGNLLIHGTAETGDNVSILTYAPVNTSRSGMYKCKSEQNRGLATEEATIKVEDVHVKTTDAEFEYKKDAFLGCEIQIPNATIVWMKNNTNVTDLQKTGSTEYVPHNNGTLEFRNPTREDAGVYLCTYTTPQRQTVKIPVPFYAKAMVLPFDKSKNLVQEERLEIRCKVLGYPQPTIEWHKDDVAINLDEPNSRFQLSEVDGFPNARLEIGSVNFDDAGNYMCLARSTKYPEINSNQTIHIRVKDKELKTNVTSWQPCGHSLALWQRWLCCVRSYLYMKRNATRMQMLRKMSTKMEQHRRRNQRVCVTVVMQITQGLERYKYSIKSTDCLKVLLFLCLYTFSSKLSFLHIYADFFFSISPILSSSAPVTLPHPHLVESWKGGIWILHTFYDFWKVILYSAGFF